MKRYLIPTVIVLAALLVIWPTFAQAKGSSKGKSACPESGSRGRGRTEQSNVEEPEGSAPGTQVQEREQRPPGPPGSYRDRKWPRRAEGKERYLKSVDRDITNFKEKKGQFIAELKAIHELALQERASKTAERLERLVAKQQKKFEKELQKLQQKRERIQKMFQERTRGKAGVEGIRKQRQERLRRQSPTTPKLRERGRGKGKAKPEPPAEIE